MAFIIKSNAQSNLIEINCSQSVEITNKTSFQPSIRLYESVPDCIVMLGEESINTFNTLKPSIVGLMAYYSEHNLTFDNTSELVNSADDYNVAHLGIEGNSEDVKSRLSAVLNNDFNVQEIIEADFSDVGKQIYNELNSEYSNANDISDIKSINYRYAETIVSSELNDFEKGILTSIILVNELIVYSIELEVEGGAFFVDEHSEMAIGINETFTNNENHTFKMLGWWDRIKKAVKCAAGTVGGALVGAVGGAAVGTITVPMIGTVSGTVVGFYGGALTGAASSCF
ncbi:MAG: hypothetical protein AMXMBFR79_18910 [Chitinophagaceae bacterium]